MYFLFKRNIYNLIIKSLSFFIPTTFLLLFIYNYGVLDIESTFYGFFTLKILFSDFKNFFFNYISSIGPGIELPIGQGLFFFITSPFININFKLFFFSTLLTGFLIQIIFITKILEFLKIKNYTFLTNSAVLLSISNFSYLFFEDWIELFINYTFYYPIIYYLLKLKINNSFNIYLKLVFWISIMIINGHLGYTIIFFHFLILFIIFNHEYFLLLKNKKTYFSLVLFIIIIFESFFQIINTYFQYLNADPSLSKIPHRGFNIIDLIYAFLYPLFAFLKLLNIDFFLSKEIPTVYISRTPFYGFTFFVSLIYSIFLIFKKRSKEIFNLNIIYLILIILLLLPKSFFHFGVSAIWQYRDISNILSLIIFFYFISNFFTKYLNNKILLKIIFTGTILTNTYLILFTIFDSVLNKFNSNISENYFNDYNQILDQEIFNRENEKNLLQRIYFGSELYEYLYSSENFLSKNNSLSSNDFYLKTNISPFNLRLKNSYTSIRYPNEQIMFQNINPIIDEINNKYFNSIFRIKYLLIFKQNLNLYNSQIFDIQDSFKYGHNDILLLVNNQFDSFTIINDIEPKVPIECNRQHEHLCVFKKDFLLFNKNIKIQKLDENKYEIINYNNFSVKFILPFSFNYNWKTNNNIKINNFQKNLSYIQIDSNSKINLIYSNKFRFYFKIISVLSIISLIIYLLAPKAILKTRNIFS